MVAPIERLFLEPRLDRIEFVDHSEQTADRERLRRLRGRWRKIGCPAPRAGRPTRALSNWLEISLRSVLGDARRLNRADERNSRVGDEDVGAAYGSGFVLAALSAASTDETAVL